MTRVADFRILLDAFGAGQLEVFIPVAGAQDPNDGSWIEGGYPVSANGTTRGLMVDATEITPKGGVGAENEIQFFDRGTFEPGDMVVLLPKNPVLTQTSSALPITTNDGESQALVFINPDDGEKYGLIKIRDYSTEGDVILCLARRQETDE